MRWTNISNVIVNMKTREYHLVNQYDEFYLPIWGINVRISIFIVDKRSVSVWYFYKIRTNWISKFQKIVTPLYISKQRCYYEYLQLRVSLLVTNLLSMLLYPTAVVFSGSVLIIIKKENSDQSFDKGRLLLVSVDSWLAQTLTCSL